MFGSGVEVYWKKYECGTLSALEHPMRYLSGLSLDVSPVQCLRFSIYLDNVG